MTTAEKLAKLKSQVDLACDMIKASDPQAAATHQRDITSLILRITGDMTLGHYDDAAKAAGNLRAAVLRLQAAWARGESSATGRALTKVETLAAEIEAELRRKANPSGG
jgi:hypothetical protein